MDTYLDTSINYQTKLDNAIRLTSVINELIAGKSLTEACQAADIREEAVKGFFAMPVRTKNPKNDAMPDWRSDFMKEIYGDGNAVLSDFNECYDYFKSTLTTEQAKVLVGKFEKKMTFSALGQEMGVSSARIHKLIDELNALIRLSIKLRIRCELMVWQGSPASSRLQSLRMNLQGWMQKRVGSKKALRCQK